MLLLLHYQTSSCQSQLSRESEILSLRIDQADDHPQLKSARPVKDIVRHGRQNGHIHNVYRYLFIYYVITLFLRIYICEGLGQESSLERMCMNVVIE